MQPQLQQDHSRRQAAAPALNNRSHSRRSRSRRKSCWAVRVSWTKSRACSGSGGCARDCCGATRAVVWRVQQAQQPCGAAAMHRRPERLEDWLQLRATRLPQPALCQVQTRVCMLFVLGCVCQLRPASTQHPSQQHTGRPQTQRQERRR